MYWASALWNSLEVPAIILRNCLAHNGCVLESYDDLMNQGLRPGVL